MGNKLKKVKDKLKARQADYDAKHQSDESFKRPGSMNAKKQNTAGTTTAR